MKDRREQIPEYLLRLLVLRFLYSCSPAQVLYKDLEKIIKEKANCSPQKLKRVLAYQREKTYIEGEWDNVFPPPNVTRYGLPYKVVKITAKGIHHLEKLEQEIRLELEKEEKERNIGYQP